MEDMKLFKVIIISSSLIFFSQCTSKVQSITGIDGVKKNIPNPIKLTESELRDPGKNVWNNRQYLNFFLDHEEKKLHQSAVFNSLNNIRDNEITYWHSQNNTFGIIRITHSFELSAGYCRVYQAIIQVESEAKQMTNKACKRGTSDWIFLK